MGKTKALTRLPKTQPAPSGAQKRKKKKEQAEKEKKGIGNLTKMTRFFTGTLHCHLLL